MLNGDHLYFLGASQFISTPAIAFKFQFIIDDSIETPRNGGWRRNFGCLPRM